MSKFDEREKEFEARFKHDQEFAFKATARRNKLLGLWAADRLGLDGAAAQAYAAEVVGAEYGKGGDHHVVDKIVADFLAKGVKIDTARVADELQRCAADAKAQMMKG
jgi:hypothetical protein